MRVCGRCLSRGIMRAGKRRVPCPKGCSLHAHRGRSRVVGPGWRINFWATVDNDPAKHGTEFDVMNRLVGFLNADAATKGEKP